MIITKKLSFILIFVNLSYNCFSQQLVPSTQVSIKTNNTPIVQTNLHAELISIENRLNQTNTSISGITVEGASLGSTNDIAYTNITKVIYSKESGLHVDNPLPGTALIYLGSYWEELFLDDGLSYKPTGAQPLAIKMNPNLLIEGTAMDTNTTPWTLYIPKTSNGSNISGPVKDTNVFTSTNLVVALGSGGSVGGITNGMSIPTNTDLQTIFRLMLQKQIAPTYTGPSFTISGSPLAGNFEAGTWLTNIITSTYTSNDAGHVTNYIVYRDTGSGYTSVTTASTIVSYTSPSTQIGDNTNRYYSTVLYSQGAVKNDNLGNPYPYIGATPNINGGYSAGTISSSVLNYYGKRKLWYGADISTNGTPTSSDIRSFTNSILGTANGVIFTNTISIGSTRVVIAYPTNLNTISSIISVEQGYADVLDTFSIQTNNVQGTNSYTAIPYRIYVYKPFVAYGSVSHYIITIAN